MKPFNIFLFICVSALFLGFVVSSGRSQTSQPQQEVVTELVDRSPYVPYSENAFAAAQEKEVTLLFFAATKWCQSCSELEKEIMQRIAEIPEGVTILKVDYDNDRALTSKYGVTSQHTLVALDSEGTELYRWLGGDFDFLVKKIEGN